MAPVHNRTPAILPPEACDEWLAQARRVRGARKRL